jgi:hypothetical protein
MLPVYLQREERQEHGKINKRESIRENGGKVTKEERRKGGAEDE